MALCSRCPCYIAKHYKMKYLAKYIHMLAWAFIAHTAAALPAGHFTTESQLAGGHWVKIKVSHTGMQRLTDSQLRQWGFANPDKVAVYGLGGVMPYEANNFTDPLPDDLQPTASLRHGSSLIFYGEGADRLYVRSQNSLTYVNSVYDTAGYYYLCESPSPQRVSYSDTRVDKSLEPVDEFLYPLIYQPDIYNPAMGGYYWLGPELDHGNRLDVGFDLTDYNESSAVSDYASMGYTFVAKNIRKTTALDITYPSAIEVTYQNHRTASATEDDVCYYSAPATSSLRFVPAAAGAFNDTPLTWGFNVAAASTPDYAAIKNVWIIYPRKADLRSLSQLALCYPNGRPAQTFTLKSDRRLEVWNIANPTAVYAYHTTYDSDSELTTGTFDQHFSPGTNRNRMIAFDPDGSLYEPEFAGEVANQNIHGDPTPDMAIITTDELYQYAVQLADIHRSRGKIVNVYTHRQVLNEFSSGANAPIAYRMMAKMFYDRDPERFRYLLLYGPATWDPRGMVEQAAGERLLTYLCESADYMRRLTANYSSDSYFGLLDDKYVHSAIEQAAPSIAVGRINVENALRAQNVNDKILDYINNPYSPEIFATLLAISDSGDGFAHLDQSEDVDSRLRGGRPGSTTVKIPLAMYPISNGKSPVASKMVHSALFSGAGLFNYSGHGSSVLFSTASIWSINESTTLSYSVPPLAVLSTCNAYEFDHGSNDIASQMLFKSGGGSIASIGACRKVYLMHNGILNSALADAYAGARPGATIGDVFVEGRRRAIANSRGVVSAMVNHMCYNLCGDPMTPLHVPDYRASVTTLAGRPVNEADTGAIAVAIGDRVRLQGHIHDADGNTRRDFNGTVKLILYDGPQRMTAVNRYPSDPQDKSVTTEYDVLATYGATVTDGTFDTELTLPMPRTPDQVNRIVIAAVSEEGSSNRTTALGECCSMVISSTAIPARTVDVAEPTISHIATSSAESGNSSDFAPDEVITVSAIVTAPGGIAGATGLVGAQPRIAVDDNNELDLNYIQVSIDADGNYLLQGQLGSLQAGRHNVTLSLCDNLGRYVARSLAFTVMPNDINATLTIAEQPARTRATIDLQCDESVIGNRLIIEDASGATVFSAADCAFPYTWSMRGMGGSPVPDGRYTATVLLTTPTRHGASEPCSFIVVKSPRNQ